MARAMLDVAVVAVLIVTVKPGAVVSILRFGLHVPGAAVLLIMLIASKVVQLTDNHSEEQTAFDKSYKKNYI